MDHLDALLTRKEGHQEEGLLDDLVRYGGGEGGLDRFTLVRMAVIQLTAGQETNANMISIGTCALLRTPNASLARKASTAPWFEVKTSGRPPIEVVERLGRGGGAGGGEPDCWLG
ncbi:hypothetical protein ACFVT2_20610 [Streptomyces sp. NPDC058000]|uniref:hypothetical protein n=1 Tax=Streptomyces sp. NPDC058000 TaxID=3346299 RepID=UPI0036EF2134